MRSRSCKRAVFGVRPPLTLLRAQSLAPRPSSSFFLIFCLNPPALWDLPFAATPHKLGLRGQATGQATGGALGPPPLCRGGYGRIKGRTAWRESANNMQSQTAEPTTGRIINEIHRIFGGRNGIEGDLAVGSRSCKRADFDVLPPSQALASCCRLPREALTPHLTPHLTPLILQVPWDLPPCGDDYGAGFWISASFAATPYGLGLGRPSYGGS